MRVGIFVAMSGRKAGGIETYEHDLIRSLAEIDRENSYDVFCTDAAAAAAFHLAQPNVAFRVLRPNNRLLSIPFGLSVQLARRRCDVVHATYVPALWSPAPQVFTMHDTSVFDHPEFYHVRHRRMLQVLQLLGLKRARVVICPSETMRQRVNDRFDISSDKLVVIPHGISGRFRPLDKRAATALVRDRYAIRSPYVLYVGQLRTKHKNILRILEAFHRFRHAVDRDVKLVLAGNRSWTTEAIDETIARLGLVDQVVELGYLGQDELPALYSGAELFVFPSLSEGFGFVAAEALACGIPVVTSSITALPEVVGDAAVLVDPYSVDDIAAGMGRAFSDPALREELRAKGPERARQFTWERCASQTLAVYRKALAR